MRGTRAAHRIESPLRPFAKKSTPRRQRIEIAATSRPADSASTIGRPMSSTGLLIETYR